MAPRWGLFAAVVLLVAAAFLSLARATSRAFESSGDGEGTAPLDRPDDEAPGGPDSEATDPPTLEASDATNPPDAFDSIAPAEDPTPADEPGAADPGDEGGSRVRDPLDVDSSALLANAALSQLLVGLPLVGVAWYARVPGAALGIDPPVLDAVLPGIGLGVGIYLLNEAGALTVERLGFDADEGLRELLAPDSVEGWVLLLGVALPLIAAVEEFLFRAALIGGLAAGFDLPVWGLAVLSSLLFAVGHGLQGPGGVIVTGILGYGLAAAFVLTGSLWVVILAHYLVNALEFVVHEGLGVELGRAE